MQHTLGLLMYGNDAEIMEDSTFGKGSFLGLHATMAEADKMMTQNSKIKQINVYKTIKGNPPQLVHSLVREDCKPE